MNDLAPIVIFAFNRLDVLKRMVESLKGNAEAAKSDLFVFVDGPRPGRLGEDEKVCAVREYVRGIEGFKSLHYTFSDTNKGLACSVIDGTTKVINDYGKVIVVEDDLEVSTNFLAFMNEGLRRYEYEDKVFSVCGYTNKVKIPAGYAADAYFCTRSSSWGWATWKGRWLSVDWRLDDWPKFDKMGKAFNRWGGSDCHKMLSDWKRGRNSSWAIRFCFSQFIQGKLSLFPTVSKVRNGGFDGQGTNCKKWSRFKCDFDVSGNKEFIYPVRIEMDKRLYKSAMAYNGLAIRLWSRLMYALHR